MPTDWLQQEQAAENLPAASPGPENADTQQFYLQAILALLGLIREFSLDLTELDAETFKERNQTIAMQFDTRGGIKRLRKRFELHKDLVLDYINREKTYFSARDAEFKNIIDILFAGLTEINKENKEFNVQIYERNVKLEEITELTDIRELKESLKAEVADLKQQIQNKQSRDSVHMDKLAESVEVLKDDLEKARQDSQTDGLTGAMNRLAFDTSIRELVDRSAIVWKSFGLLMIDVDDFKRVNDQYGHLIGDRVLLALVEQVKRHTRKDDIVARYGGEEFVIILPDTSYRRTLKKARLLCRSIARTDYPLDGQPGDNLAFTVSIGVATLQQGDTPTLVVDRADRAMYHAKHLGKNQAVGAEDNSTSFVGKLWSGRSHATG